VLTPFAGGVEQRPAVVGVLGFDPELARSLEAFDEVVRVAVEADDHRDRVLHWVLLFGPLLALIKSPGLGGGR
jgi:hypothetical protein